MLHGMLDEMLATVHPEARGAMIAEISRRAEPLCDQLACYWLLDDSKDVRLGAAAALLHRAQNRAMDAAMVSRILEARAWQPADDARTLLDRAIKESLRRELSGGVEPKPWTLHRILGSIPDGVGAQSIAIAAQYGGRRGVVMILLKQNFGIKDAYVVPCASASEQRLMLDRMLNEIDMVELSPAFLRPALAAALAEGAASNALPPHALIDIVEILGLPGLQPEPLRVQDWASHLDPEGVFATLSPQKLGRLVNESSDWPENHPIIHSWYEDSEDIQNIMISAITPRTRETALWKHLETRRDWWAEVFVKAAFALKAEKGRTDNSWISFMVTAMAMTQRRLLRKVPIMRWIVEGSLDRVENPWAHLGSMPHDDFSEAEELPDLPLEYTPPAPEKKGELARILKSASMTVKPHWLEGYLAAIVLAPNMMSPTDWIGGLLDLEHSFKTEKQMQRFLDLILHRYNAANVDLPDTVTMKVRLANLADPEGIDWASGFSESAKCHADAWNAPSTNKDDKTILKAITAAAKSEGELQNLSAVLSTWFARRYALRK
jgi:yecA family protein